MNTMSEIHAKAQGYTFEKINCLTCDHTESNYFLSGQDDLTSKDGNFVYVKCPQCQLVYQNPRIVIDQIKDYYDSEYIAHRKKKDWGVLQPFYERAMNKHDNDKVALIERYVELNKHSNVLDVGCAVGTFLNALRKKYDCQIHGVDFKSDLNFPDFDKINFKCGLFYEQDFANTKFDLITMWHFLEHCYEPKKSLLKARDILSDNGRLIIEVPRLDSLTFKVFKNKWPGVQAPQHTVLFDKNTFLNLAEDAGYEVVEYLPYGAFPAYFYIFAGSWFKFVKRKFDLDKAIAPYFMGQLALTPLLLMQKKLNLAMQTAVLRKR